MNILWQSCLWIFVVVFLLCTYPSFYSQHNCRRFMIWKITRQGILSWLFSDILQEDGFYTKDADHWRSYCSRKEKIITQKKKSQPICENKFTKCSSLWTKKPQLFSITWNENGKYIQKLSCINLLNYILFKNGSQIWVTLLFIPSKWWNAYSSMLLCKIIYRLERDFSLYRIAWASLR